jgi:hypothetical protein
MIIIEIYLGFKCIILGVQKLYEQTSKLTVPPLEKEAKVYVFHSKILTLHPH